MILQAFTGLDFVRLMRVSHFALVYACVSLQLAEIEDWHRSFLRISSWLERQNYGYLLAVSRTSLEKAPWGRTIAGCSTALGPDRGWTRTMPQKKHRQD